MSNENGAIQAVIAVIEANKAALTTGIVEQGGRERTIEYLADTVMGQPTGYYALKVHCENVLERNHPEVYNVNKATPYQTQYQMKVLVGEDALFDEGDSAIGKVVGSTAHANYRTFTDRLVVLFRRTVEWYPTKESTPRYRILLSRDGRAVRKKHWMPEPSQTGGLLGSEITFTLVGCND